jgi:hypothetical protein
MAARADAARVDEARLECAAAARGLRDAAARRRAVRAADAVSAGATLDVVRALGRAARARLGAGLADPSCAPLEVAARARDPALAPSVLRAASRAGGLLDRGCVTVYPLAGVEGGGRAWQRQYAHSVCGRRGGAAALSLDHVLAGLRSDPGDLELHSEAGVRYLRQGRHELALRYLERGLSRSGAPRPSSKARAQVRARALHLAFEARLLRGLLRGERPVAGGSAAEGDFRRAATHMGEWLALVEHAPGALREAHETIRLACEVAGPDSAQAEAAAALPACSLGALLDLDVAVLRRLTEREPAEEADLAALGALLAHATDFVGARAAFARARDCAPPAPAPEPTPAPASGDLAQERDWTFDEDDDVPAHAQRKGECATLRRRLALCATSEARDAVSAAFADRARLAQRRACLAATVDAPDGPCLPVFDRDPASLEAREEASRLERERAQRGMMDEEVHGWLAKPHHAREDELAASLRYAPLAAGCRVSLPPRYLDPDAQLRRDDSAAATALHRVLRARSAASGQPD